MEQASHLIASKIVNQYVKKEKILITTYKFYSHLLFSRALDIKNLDRAESMRKLEAAYKREIVERTRV
jgi:hypothetical protein